MKYKSFSYTDGKIFTITTTDIYNVSSVATKLLVSIQSILILFIFYYVCIAMVNFCIIFIFCNISIIITGLLGRKSKR